ENEARARAELMFKVREFQKADASKATADYHAVEQRLRDRTQELRKLRLLREAQGKQKRGPHLDGSAYSMRITSRTKAVRNRVDISSKQLTRHWCKYFGTSKDKIEAAVAKVGDNPETVQKEILAQRKLTFHSASRNNAAIFLTDVRLWPKADMS